MSNYPVSFGLLNLGGGEIVLILVLLCILAVIALAFFGLVFFIVRAAQKRSPPVPAAIAPDDLALQQVRDLEHLKLMSIFHFVFGGLALIGIGLLFVHYGLMHSAFSNPDIWKSNPQALPPKEFLEAFNWVYVFMGVLLLAGLAANVLSGVFLWQKRYRTFSMIVAGLDCFQVPFGTALGVFTLIVLSRDSVRALYAGEPRSATFPV